MLFNLPALLLLLLAHGSAGANDSSLKPFEAGYEVYSNEQHVADAHFSLRHENGAWLWRMRTKPIGLYRWLTRKKPFAETRMTMTPKGLRLSQLSAGDYVEKPPQESSWFDVKGKSIYYTHSTENEEKQLQLPDNLYSFHDVHRLYQQMKRSGQQQLVINFYDKGRLFTSTLILESSIQLPGGVENSTVDKLSQELQDTDKMMTYYYRDHDLAPLRIERFKRGKLQTMMQRASLQE